MGEVVEWSLVDGVLPVAVALAGAAGLLALLLLGGDRRWFTRVLPVVVVAVGGAVGIGWVVVSALRPFRRDRRGSTSLRRT